MTSSKASRRPRRGSFLICSVFTAAVFFSLATLPAQAQPDNGTWPLAGTWSRDAHDTVAWVDLTHWTLVTSATGAPFASRPAADLPWIPVAGDWDGDGVDSVRMFHRRTWQVIPLEQGPVEVAGDPSPTPWVPVAGDWEGDGLDTVAVYDRRDGELHRLEEGPGRLDGYVPGPNPVTPMAGDWEGDGIDTLSTLEERRDEASEPAAWAILSGDWDGDGIDTDASLYLATGELVFPEAEPLRSLAGGSSAATQENRGIAGIFEPVNACYTKISNWHQAIHKLKYDVGGCLAMVVTSWTQTTCCLSFQKYYSCTSELKFTYQSYGYAFC